MEGYDDLGSHMVGQPTLQLENFNLTLPNARKIVLSYYLITFKTVGLIIGSFQELVRDCDCDCVSYLMEVCIVSMHSNCEQIRQI